MKLQGIENFNQNVFSAINMRNKELEQSLIEQRIEFIKADEEHVRKIRCLESENRDLLYSLGRQKLEFDSSIARRDALDASNQELTVRLDETKSEIEKLKAELSAKNDDLEKENQHLLSRLETEKKAATKMESELTSIKSILKFWTDRHQSLESEHLSLVDQVNLRNQEHSATIEEWKQKVAALDKEKVELASYFNQKELSFIDLNVNLIGKNQGLTTENHDLRLMIDKREEEMVQRLETIKAEKNALDQLLTDQKKESETLRAAFAQFNVEKKAFEESKTEIEQLKNEFSTAKAKLNAENRDLGLLLEQQKLDTHELSCEWSKKNCKLISDMIEIKGLLKKKEKDYDKSSDHLNAIIDSLKEEKRTLERDLQREKHNSKHIVKKLSYMKSDAYHLKNLASKRRDEIDTLKDDLKKLKKVFAELKGKIFVLENKNSELEVRIDYFF